jgi:metallophosphoesterase (TIGR00282 family)
MRLAGIDFFTSGDHIFREKGTEDFIDSLPIVRPANYPQGTSGKGYEIVDAGKAGKILVMNLMGRTSFNSIFAYLEDPFRTADKILDETSDENLSAVIVDFHADATSEKYALAHYLDGRVTAFVGSSTHAPTADNMVLPNGTLFVSDIGMIGSIDSVIGVKKEIIINMFLSAQNQKFEWEKSGRTAFRSVLIDTEKRSIERIDKILN